MLKVWSVSSMDNIYSITKSFEGTSFRINCNSGSAVELVNFLLQDIPSLASSAVRAKELDLLVVGKAPYLSLWDGDKKLYHGRSWYKASYTLINLILFYSIAPNKNHHAIHAGAVFHGRNAILLPGSSGAGKSTLTAWLLTKGYRYLTDELVMLSKEGKIRPFPRPISFKNGGVEPFLTYLDKHKVENIIRDDAGAMVPHRFLNSDYEYITPELTKVIYPQFQAGAKTVVEELSPARSCLRLLTCHVNGRNLDDLGIKNLSTILRTCKSYSLTYGKFEGLEQVLYDHMQN